MLFTELAKSLKQELQNIYVISGEDEFLIQKAQDMIFAACEISYKDIDFSCYDDDNFDIDAFSNAYMQLPMMAKKRMMLVKNISAINESVKKKLIALFANCNEGQVVCFVSYAGFQKFDFLSGATFVDCQKLNYMFLKKYILDCFAKKQLKISEDAIKQIVEMSNGNLTKITSELEKLTSLASAEELVDEDFIKEYFTKDEEYEVFELTNAIALKQGEKSLAILKFMLDNKTEPQSILGLLIQNMRRIFFGAICDLSNADLARELGVKEYAIKKARENAQKFSAKELKNINDTLCDVDYLTKSGEMPFDNALYYLITKIC